MPSIPVHARVEASVERDEATIRIVQEIFDRDGDNVAPWVAEGVVFLVHKIRSQDPWLNWRLGLRPEWSPRGRRFIGVERHCYDGPFPCNDRGLLWLFGVVGGVPRPLILEEPSWQLVLDTAA